MYALIKLDQCDKSLHDYTQDFNSSYAYWKDDISIPYITYSVSFNKNVKRERSDSEKNFESWNKAKKRLSTNEYNKRRKTNACINCGEVGHKFSECPKP